ncbi:hypothetical protein LTR85_011058 [Meristemomyces frigidus]|nr:hypothetical protein LTR85_011058 [Meristemomyces frigidus]
MATTINQQPSNDHENCIASHNNVRTQKGCRPLQWHDGLAHEAETYAQRRASMNKMQHSGAQGQGENLYMSTGDAPFEQAVQSWLGEEKKYRGEMIGEGNFAEWGHFTQCLWHGTTHVGMGKAKAQNGSTYIVARYWPQGNMAGERPF